MRTKVVFAIAAGCSITAGSIACGMKPPAEDVRTVKGSMSIAVRERLPGAWVVAQDDKGKLYLGRLRTDNSFELKLPTSRSYRLVVANGAQTSDRGSVGGALPGGGGAGGSTAPGANVDETNGTGGAGIPDPGPPGTETPPSNQPGVPSDETNNGGMPPAGSGGTGGSAGAGAAGGAGDGTAEGAGAGGGLPGENTSGFDPSAPLRGMTTDGTAPAVAKVLWPNGEPWLAIDPSREPIDLGTIGPQGGTLDRYGNTGGAGGIAGTGPDNGGGGAVGSSGEIPTYPGTGDAPAPNGTSSSSSGAAGASSSSGTGGAAGASSSSGTTSNPVGSSSAVGSSGGTRPGDGIGSNPYTPGGAEKAKFRAPSRICIPGDQGTWQSTAKPPTAVSKVVAPANEARLAITCEDYVEATAKNGGADGYAGGAGAGQNGTSDQGGDGYGNLGPPIAGGPTQPQCDFDERAIQDPASRLWDCVKMETPVTYFYSDRPMKVRASVEFPRGVLTQWYPAVRESWPSTKMLSFATTGASARNARVCEASPSLETTTGLLDWGSLDILGREANVEREIPQASLENFTWSFARQVAANPVRGENGQAEKFLFYRGIGNFVLPVTITAQGHGRLVMKSSIADAVPAVFVLNVEGDRGTYTAHRQGIDANANLAAQVPSMKDAKPIEDYADALARDVRSALDAQGLYDDEATAMVNTWKRQWFRTPGIRVLYLAPQSWTDRSLPLAIEPKPDTMVRVMVMRVEVITPELERADVAAVKKLASPETAPEAVRHFDGLGRFAEPRLRRASWLAGKPAYATPLLATVIATNKTRHDPTAGTTPLTPDAKGPAFAGKGFVVHEWGTDTIVVGSDGSQQLGLQHEEEDLPKFVYDRRKEH